MRTPGQPSARAAASPAGMPMIQLGRAPFTARVSHARPMAAETGFTYLLVYRNDSHMTVPFSRWLAPVLWPAVQHAARTSRES